MLDIKMSVNDDDDDDLDWYSHFCIGRLGKQQQQDAAAK